MPSLTGHAPTRYIALLNIALVILMIPPFAADLALPLGMSVWVLYLFPIVLSYLSARPIVANGGVAAQQSYVVKL